MVVIYIPLKLEINTSLYINFMTFNILFVKLSTYQKYDSSRAICLKWGTAKDKKRVSRSSLAKNSRKTSCESGQEFPVDSSIALVRFSTYYSSMYSILISNLRIIEEGETENGRRKETTYTNLRNPIKFMATAAGKLSIPHKWDVKAT